MSGLSDLLPGPRSVEIDGKSFAVRGLSLAEFAGLLTRFPALDAIFSGKGPDKIMDVLKAGNPAVGAIIATGLDHADDADWEADAAAMPAAMQVKFLADILPLTMPSGFGPFLQDLARVLGTLFPQAPDQLKEEVLRKATRKRSQLLSSAGAVPTIPSGNSRPDSSPPTGI
jgi:hypothetical protein